MITHGDALAQLPQARAVQAVAQFRLAEQDDLQQLAVVGLDVGEQADLFEQFLGQILRLVNDEHGFPALPGLFQQKFADGRDASSRSRPRFAGRIPLRWPSSIHPRSHRVQNDRGGKMAVELLQHGSAQRRLARAHLAGELDEALALADAVQQVVVCLPVMPVVKENEGSA